MQTQATNINEARTAIQQGAARLDREGIHLGFRQRELSTVQHRRHQSRLPPNIAPANLFSTPVAAPVETAGAPMNGPAAPPPETGVNTDPLPARYQPVLQVAPVPNLVYQPPLQQDHQQAQ